MIPPRPYQQRGLDLTRAALARGRKRICIVCSTGGGKTVVASHIIAGALGRGNPSLFVAHRRELIKQCFCKLVRNGVPIDQIGIIIASIGADPCGVPLPSQGQTASLSDDQIWSLYARARPHAPVQVASIDTLRGRTKPPAKLIIVDEAHRVLAVSYRDLIAVYPSAVVIGLTATPYRADGRGLGEVFEELVVLASFRELADEGFLVEPRIWTVPATDLPDLTGIAVKNGDYDAGQLSVAVDQKQLVGNIVEHWMRHARGIRTVAFAVGVEHSKHIVEQFLAAGVAAEHLDGETPTEERDAILGRLERGETLVVSSVDVLTEGWDQPSVKCAILARPTKSERIYRQSVGRILRPFEGQDAIILDHAGCVLEYGLPQQDREYTLEARKKRPRSSVPSAKACVCLAVLFSTTRVCPNCGHVFPAAEGRDIEQRDGQLVEVRATDAADAATIWEQIVKRWSRDNEKRLVPRMPGWCAIEFKKRCPGQRIPGKLPELAAVLRERRAKFDELRAQGEMRGHRPGWAVVQLKEFVAKQATAAPSKPPVDAEPRYEVELEEWAV